MARTFNLLVSNGTPQVKVKVAAVVHAQRVLSILTDENFKEKYGIPNPTLGLVAKLKEAGSSCMSVVKISAFVISNQRRFLRM